MKALALLALAALVGCNATMPQQRVSAEDDPTLACLRHLEGDQRFAVLKAKTGRPDQLTIQMLTDQSKPNDAEKLAIRIGVVARQTCLEMGHEFRARNAPAYFIDEVARQDQDATLLSARLYAGELTFGEFNRARQSAYQASKDRFSAARDRAQATEAQARAAQAQERAASAANTALIMQMLRPQPAPALIQPQVVCSSRRIGNRVETVCD